LNIVDPFKPLTWGFTFFARANPVRSDLHRVQIFAQSMEILWRFCGDFMEKNFLLQIFAQIFKNVAKNVAKNIHFYPHFGRFYAFFEFGISHKFLQNIIVFF
jgi:hypothetical protein